VRRALALACAFLAPGVASAAPVPAAVAIAPFSGSAPGAALPPGWRALTLPGIASPDLSLVEDEGATVLRVDSHAAAGAALHALRIAAPDGTALAWRWKIDHVVADADLARRSGDDFAARVYVFFDRPLSELPLAARIVLGVQRLLHGADLPAAALCYVWDNRHAAGTTAWSAYTGRVRMVVLESGNAQAGQWRAERRDLAADYHAAFGEGSRVPPVTGIAAGNDTDQTGASASAWFGDFRLERGRPDAGGRP
jgi:DUF3047 family protein